MIVIHKGIYHIGNYKNLQDYMHNIYVKVSPNTYKELLSLDDFQTRIKQINEWKKYTMEVI